MDFYVVHETNPNDKIGGGGCVATGAHAGEDCKGPWIEFPRVSTEYDASPYTVICEYHFTALKKGYRRVEQVPAGDELPLRDVRRRGTFATT